MATPIPNVPDIPHTSRARTATSLRDRRADLPGELRKPHSARDSGRTQKLLQGADEAARGSTLN